MFVFGEDISSFAFGVLPIIIFFSMIISILYYVGFMPYIIGKISWLFEVSCDTSGPETTACAGNIFVGMTESPLLIRNLAFNHKILNHNVISYRQSE